MLYLNLQSVKSPMIAMTLWSVWTGCADWSVRQIRSAPFPYIAMDIYASKPMNRSRNAEVIWSADEENYAFVFSAVPSATETVIVLLQNDVNVGTVVTLKNPRLSVVPVWTAIMARIVSRAHATPGAMPRRAAHPTISVKKDTVLIPWPAYVTATVVRKATASQASVNNSENPNK